jgi:radical SAM superfamily enzyme YgiQ (UPF0313 family)
VEGDRVNPSVLLVDLNNFARYPTLTIGLLVASLRRAEIDVEVLCPLRHGVPPVVRERQERVRDHLERRIYFSTHPLMVGTHDALRARWAQRQGRPHPRVIEEARRALDERPVDALLLSAYLDQHPTVVELGELAVERGVPLLVGGPALNLRETAQDWLAIPGITAIVGAEADPWLPELVRDLADGADLTRFPGTVVPGGGAGEEATPLRALGGLPVPDFSDFPWDSYPQRILPVMTGRGCGWGRCVFCSDVSTANGRTFRSRPVDDVLDELETQADRYGTKDVIFLDIKLNSDVSMWRSITSHFQDRLPGGHWIGTVHVDQRDDNGLSASQLRDAYKSGMRRVTFGLETGSQRVNQLMDKGTTMERNAEFVHHAHEAGMSVRTTVMVGYPGETADDLEATAAFLDAHSDCLDRVRPSLFKAIPGTRFDREHQRRPESFPGLARLEWDHRLARGHYRYTPASKRRYRRAKTRVLEAVHAINRRPLRSGVEMFDGLM